MDNEKEINLNRLISKYGDTHGDTDQYARRRKESSEKQTGRQHQRPTDRYSRYSWSNISVCVFQCAFKNAESPNS